MPAISGRKICRKFRVGRYAGDFGLKKKCRQYPIVTKCRQVRAGKKMPVFSGGDKIAGKLAIAGELTGLYNDEVG